MSFSPLETQSPGWLLTVDPQGDGERLDRFISRRLPRVSRTRASKLQVYELDPQGFLKKTGLKKSTRLQALQTLWIERPVPPENLSLLERPKIIDECNDFLVIDKPTGWVVHPTASRFHSAITTWLKAQGYQAQPVHRLDCETSGILICAKTQQVEAELQQLFLEHKVQKEYVALCHISPQGQAFLEQQGIDQSGKQWLETTSLGFDLRSQIKIKMGRGLKDAITHFKVLSVGLSSYRSTLLSDRELNKPTVKHDHYLCVKARPKSGRQHQIRVHLSLRGLPLLGDKLYGLDEEYFLKGLAGKLTQEDYQKLGHDRHALHASELSFIWKNQKRLWHSPLPQDLQNLLNQ